MQMHNDSHEQMGSFDEACRVLRSMSSELRLEVERPETFRWRRTYLETPELRVWRARTIEPWHCYADEYLARLYVALPLIGELNATVKLIEFVAAQGRSARYIFAICTGLCFWAPLAC
ncbi:hypothetical protein ACVIIW_007279 [Bradyrhizobium sp. USDA 4449]